MYKYPLGAVIDYMNIQMCKCAKKKKEYRWQQPNFCLFKKYYKNGQVCHFIQFGNKITNCE